MGVPLITSLLTGKWEKLRTASVEMLFWPLIRWLVQKKMYPAADEMVRNGLFHARQLLITDDH